MKNIGTKALLSNINSLWGVIINPHSSNAYRHIISFDNESQKKEFIDKELFNNQDHDVLLDNQPDIAFTQITSTRASFRVNINDYPNETIDSLLNKDFAIIKENGEKRYYTLIGTRVGSVIEYVCDLDIFFTHDIKDMFNDKDTQIKISHTDRFYKDNNKKILPITDKKDYKQIIYNTEPFDSIDTESLIKSTENELIKVDFSKYIDPKLSDEKKKVVHEMINSCIFNIFFSSSNGAKKNIVDELDSLLEFNIFKYGAESDSYTSLPYIVYIGFSGFNKKEYIIGKNKYIFNKFEEWEVGKFGGSGVVWSAPKVERDQLENASVIKSSYSILGLPVWDSNEFGTHAQFTLKDSYNPDEYNLVLERKPIDPSEFGKYDQTIYKYMLNGGSAHEPISNLWVKKHLNENNLNKSLATEIKPFDFKNIKLDINNKTKHEFELKAFFSPYRKFELGSGTKNKQVLQPQWFTKNEIIFEISNSYMSENWGYFSVPKHYSNLYNRDYKYVDKIKFEDYANYSLPTDTKAWNEFIVRNKASQNANFLSKGLLAGAGALGVLAAPFTGGSSLGMVLGGVSLAAKSFSDINNQLAQRKDIHNTPNKITNNGSTLIPDFIFGNIKPRITEYKLHPLDDLLIKEHFYKYGYSFNNKLRNINELLKSRYYFNYIEIPQCFETIKGQFSGEIKQLINDSLANGITIWNYRNKATWKGIKNYDFENVEMSLI